MARENYEIDRAGDIILDVGRTHTIQVSRTILSQASIQLADRLGQVTPTHKLSAPSYTYFPHDNGLAIL